MDGNNDVKFLSTNFQIEFDGANVEVNGLVSVHGATRLRALGSSALSLDAAFGQPLKVFIGRLCLDGSLSKIFAADGTSHQIKFREMDDTQKSFLEHLIQIEGIHPGWIRKYPRIPVAAAESNNLPVVSLCMIRFGGEESIAPVVNFSIGGLRIEIAGNDSLATLQVGSLVSFDLMTSSGEIFKEFAGEIRNLTVSEFTEGGQKKMAKGLGIGFVGMSAELRKKFYTLIREFCNALLQRNSAIG